jgi:hypothetical protein
VYQLIKITLNPDEKSNITYTIPAFHLISFGFPILIGVLLIVYYWPTQQSIWEENETGNFGCFISHKHMVWRVVALYGPLILSWIYTLMCYVCASRKISHVLQVNNDCVMMDRCCLTWVHCVTLTDESNTCTRAFTSDPQENAAHSAGNKMLYIRCVY